MVIKWLISGRVQGVGFRYQSQRNALHLGLHGFVRNLADGQVELVLAGDEQAIASLLAWLEQGGPPFSHIDTIIQQPCLDDDFIYLQTHPKFTIRY